MQVRGDAVSLFSRRPALWAGEREPIPDYTPAYLSDLIQCCWDNDPTVRPSFRQVLHDSFSLNSLAALPQLTQRLLKRNSSLSEPADESRLESPSFAEQEQEFQSAREARRMELRQIQKYNLNSR